ncbi:uncharacterized protein N7506_005760 [Penicillium brevicompactum]|uniref:uncharacterized protein n=1 Tax=Penicillium brevicompactum TaxID=5074 RepID=UPI00253FA89F|nr:uncharacterized protein N7506_005760 [Penicillium brevicompactum]KAJ5335824.1 hypothetical protein N7506_005760 [Penicillium brevicompactum]
MDLAGWNVCQKPYATTTPTTTSAGMEMSGMMKRMDGSMSDASGSQMAVSTMKPSPSMADRMGMASSGNIGQAMGLSARGCMPPMLFRPGYSIRSLPPDTCENITPPQSLISANASQGWLALNLVNSGGVSALRVSLDRHSMHIYAADGLYVKPQEVKVIPSQSRRNGYVSVKRFSRPRFEIIWMRTNGTAKSGARELAETQLSPFEGNRPPSSKAADLTRQFTINQTGIVTWVVNKDPYAEAEIRLMGHPMHLHGHKFWVLGSGSGSFPYQSVAEAPSSIINLDDPPYRDTANVPPSGWQAIRYVTDKPGAWILHCHIQWHIVSGMALVLVEGEDRLQTLVGSFNVSTMEPSTTSGSSLAISLGKTAL